jgi:hypothetical protein
VIETTDKAQETRVQIPAALFRMRAELDTENSNEKRAEANGLPTMMVGLSLALAMSFGGLWLARQRGFTGGRSLALCLGTLTFLAISTALVWANAPPPDLGRRLGAVKPMQIDPTERVIVEIVGKNDSTVKLIISKDKLAKLVEDPNKKADK